MKTFLAFAILCSFCLPEGIYNSSKSISSKFEESGIEPYYGFYKKNNKNLHYVLSGKGSKNVILFVHGSPGTWDAYLKYLTDKKLNQDFTLISVDRPGYGFSDPGKVEISVKNQAYLINDFVKSSIKAEKIVLVGHSFGGPVVSRMVMDEPNLYNGMILIAASIDPELEKKEWFNSLGENFLIRKILPENWDVSNQEIITLKDELKSMLPLWKQVRIPVIFLQGGKDNLVYPENLQFAQKVLDHTRLKSMFFPELNHFIIWNRPDLVKTSIYNIFEEL